MQRRIALQEALRTFPVDNKLQHNEEMIKLQKELRLPPENTALWLSLPRTFSRQSARFELPLDRRQLNSESSCLLANFLWQSNTCPGSWYKFLSWPLNTFRVVTQNFSYSHNLYLIYFNLGYFSHCNFLYKFVNHKNQNPLLLDILDFFKI